MVSEAPVTEIHEIFSSYQGEGIRVGEPMIFVRFAHCDLACRYCDTPPPQKPIRMGLDELLRNVKELEARSGPHTFISLTGGEPLRYWTFLKAFLPRLKEEGFRTYLESDGTKPKELAEVVDWIDLIAMDIKLPSATGMRPFWKEHEAYLEAGQRTVLFVKVVVANSTLPAEVEHAARLTALYVPDAPFIIQPASAFGTFRDVPCEQTISLLVRAAHTHLADVRVIGQVHKLIGVR